MPKRRALFRIVGSGFFFSISPFFLSFEKGSGEEDRNPLGAESMDLDRRTIDFMGINVDALDTRGLFDGIVSFAEGKKPRKVLYLNAHCAVTALKNKAYRDVLNRADLVYPDGQSIVWAARFLGDPLPCRSTGADFLPDFCRGFAERGLRLFFLGAAPGVAEKAAERLKVLAPGLEVAGTRHGYFKPDENDEILEEISQARPHILIVGMGVPLQEFWIDENASRLDVPVVWGVGALFDFISGELARGPRILVDHGFEWLCRLCIEPRRLWKRFLWGNCVFTAYVLAERFSSRRREPARENPPQ